MNVGNLLASFLTIDERWLCPLLLATRPQIRTSSSGSTIVWVLAAVGLIIVVVAGLSLLHRMVRRRNCQSHAALFSGLCALHDLPRASRGLLKQVAAAHGLATPARLFTEPQWLEAGARSPQFRARAGELVALRDRLFGPNADAGRA